MKEEEKNGKIEKNYAVDLKLSPIFDIAKELMRLETKRKQMQRFIDKPQHLKGYVNKLSVDIVSYKEAIQDILDNCNHKSGTIKQLKEVLKNKYRIINIDEVLGKLN